MARTIKTVNLEIGNRIKQTRLKQKLTREELAKRTGYTANFIQEVERGRSGLSSESIKAFSVALNVSADEILFGASSGQSSFLFKKLEAVPEEKRKHILKILDEAIECAR